MDGIGQGPLLRSVEQWREYLRSYSDDTIRTADHYELESLTEAQREQRWLGVDPATEAQVGAAEDRLGIRLPASYRTFLLTSNGWTYIAPRIDVALPVEQIGWFREVNEETSTTCAEAWAGKELDDILELVDRALAVAFGHDGFYWLLDPGQVGQDGEWVAYSWAMAQGGMPQRDAAFSTLVVENRRLFEEMRARDGRPVHAEGTE